VTPDRFLMSLRIGRWQWPWAILGTAATLALIIAFGLAAEPIETGLAALYSRESPGTDLIPGRIDTFAGFLLFAISISLPPALVAWAVHGLDPRQLLGPNGHFDWPQLAKAALAMLSVMLLAAAIGLVREPQNYAWLGRGLPHLPWLLIAIPLILYQSFAEEYLFKGYLVRVWGAVLPIRSVIVLVIAALFTSAHAINDDVAQDLVFNLVFFFAAELLTLFVYLRTQSLAAVTGLHWINNVWAMCLVPTEPGQSTALALAAYTDPVLSAGRSRLTDPGSYLEMGSALALLLVLLVWKRSPFYLPPHLPTEPPTAPEPDGPSEVRTPEQG